MATISAASSPHRPSSTRPSSSGQASRTSATSPTKQPPASSAARRAMDRTDSPRADAALTARLVSCSSAAKIPGPIRLTSRYSEISAFSAPASAGVANTCPTTATKAYPAAPSTPRPAPRWAAVPMRPAASFAHAAPDHGSARPHGHPGVRARVTNSLYGKALPAIRGNGKEYCRTTRSPTFSHSAATSSKPQNRTWVASVV